MRPLISDAERERLGAMQQASRATSLVLTRDGVALPAQLVHVRRVRGNTVDEAMLESVPMVRLEVRGDLTLNARAGDVFAHGGKRWEVIQDAVAGEDSASLRVLAERRG